MSGKKITEINDKSIQKTIEVNQIAHHWTVKAFLNSMIERNSGHIVTVASAAGHIGVSGLVDYCSSKFGAIGFNESLRNELKSKNYKIKTTCICPYYINTGMFDGVKTKFSFLLPLLDEKYVANRIINAIR